MMYGLAKGKSVLLSDIAHALEEPIDKIQTIKRLSSRLEEFHEDNQLLENYGQIIKIGRASCRERVETEVGGEARGEQTEKAGAAKHDEGTNASKHDID